MPYPETINLPFNRSALPGGFVLHPTPQPLDNQPAQWIVLQGPNLLLCEQGAVLQLPQGMLPTALQLKTPPLAFASWQGQQLLVTAISSQTTLPEGLVAEPSTPSANGFPPS